MEKQAKNNPTNVETDLSRAGIDPVVINKLCELMGREAFFEFIKPYFTRTKANLDKIPEIIANNDFDGLHLVFHTLKGSSANVGLIAFSSLCAKIDDTAVQGDSVHPIGTMLIGARQQFEASKHALELVISQQQTINDKVA